ncbi:MAG: YcxB family protein [Clostridium sp.]|nr:YcxB family protein [Clostridium sp.]MCM1546732.1 YcxB family protein [Ruminococcus sp.]
MLKAEMKYELSDMKVFVRKSRNSAAVYLLVAFMAFIVLITLPGVIYSLKRGVDFYDIIYFLGIIMFIYFFISRMIFLPKNNLEKIKKVYGDNPIVFSFGEETFNVSAEKGASSENITLEYGKLFSVREIKDYFFIYISRNTAYIIKKSAIEGGTPYELSEMLKKRLGKKYRKV